MRLWCRLPNGVELLTRAMHDRRVAPLDPAPAGSEERRALADAVDLLRGLPVAGRQVRTLRERATGRSATPRSPCASAAPVLARPRNTIEPDLPASGGGHGDRGSYEEAPPEGQEPLHWRLLTSHHVADAEAAWRIVSWYEQRWHIEQLFRTMKRQGLDIESSQLEQADRLAKLVALATKAAAITMMMVHARDGADHPPRERRLRAPGTRPPARPQRAPARPDRIYNGTPTPPDSLAGRLDRGPARRLEKSCQGPTCRPHHIPTRNTTVLDDAGSMGTEKICTNPSAGRGGKRYGYDACPSRHSTIASRSWPQNGSPSTMTKGLPKTPLWMAVSVLLLQPFLDRRIGDRGGQGRSIRGRVPRRISRTASAWPMSRPSPNAAS